MGRGKTGSDGKRERGEGGAGKRWRLSGERMGERRRSSVVQLTSLRPLQLSVFTS